MSVKCRNVERDEDQSGSQLHISVDCTIAVTAYIDAPSALVQDSFEVSFNDWVANHHKRQWLLVTSHLMAARG
jgi:hypothetical protein